LRWIRCNNKKEKNVSKQVDLEQQERVLAGLAHGSIVLGLFTNGIGGIGTALVIWLTQKEKSAYVAAQALQALAYQVATFVVVGLVWCGWGMLWTVLTLGPLVTNPAAYDQAPPAGFWIGLTLMIVPLGISGLILLYGLWGAVRCLGGHSFRYAILGNRLAKQ
jgi:uncharacterized Tic20 family protein